MSAPGYSTDTGTPRRTAVRTVLAMNSLHITGTRAARGVVVVSALPARREHGDSLGRQCLPKRLERALYPADPWWEVVRDQECVGNVHAADNPPRTSAETGPRAGPRARRAPKGGNGS